jgi:hypothetical protein
MSRMGAVPAQLTDGPPEGAYVFAPNERPLFPGSPYAPRHTAGRRIGYALVALLTGITSNVVNSMVTVNLPSLGGAMGLYLMQVAWLPGIYVAFNATANLTLIRARIQFGIPLVMHVLLAAYAGAVVYQLVWPSYPAALATRALCGMSMATLTTMTIYCLLQVFTGPARPLALLVGISIPQLGLPLARLLPVELLALDGWRGLHLIELALIAAVTAATIALPVPPSDRSKAFEPVDALTIALVIPAFVLLGGVLAVGRYVWWTDAPWIGVALAAAVPLLIAALLIEHFRARPLIQTRWIGTAEMLRFALVAFVVRVALAEQSYGSVGLLTFGGLNNDQLHLMFGIVFLAMMLGIAAAALTIRPDRIPAQVLVASLVIAFGAWLDTDVTNLTRPPQLFLSQALIAFGTTLFIGPALLYGFVRVIQRGPDHLVTFIVLFSATQNVGGLAGSALLGSWQTMRVRHHAALLADRLSAADPIVVERIQAGSGALAGVVVDPVQRSAQGAGLLARAMLREANILAFADVFRLVMAIALANAAFLAVLIVRRRMRAAA